MSKQIPLTQGKFAIVDDEDYKWLSQWKWHTRIYEKTWYALRQVDKMPMHRFILGLDKYDKRHTDHINHLGYDNRRQNLRICTIAQNQHNQTPRQTSQSKYKGVYCDMNRKGKKIWRANLRLKNTRYKYAWYETQNEAALAYNRLALKYFGPYACLNIIS